MVSVSTSEYVVCIKTRHHGSNLGSSSVIECNTKFLLHGGLQECQMLRFKEATQFFGTEKLESIGCKAARSHDDISDRMACDEHTHRQTQAYDILRYKD